MKKDDKIVYLNEPFKPDTNLARFYKDYNIPNKFKKGNSFAIKLSDGESYIEYICPNCGAHLRAEWYYISSVYSMLEKKPSILTDSPDYVYFDNRISSYTPDDYYEAEEICKQIEKRLAPNISKIKNEIIEIANISNCPVCNAKLIKEYPYLEKCFLHIAWWPKNEHLKSIGWYEEWEKHSKGRYDGLEKIEETQINTDVESRDNYIKTCDIVSSPKPFKGDKSADFLREYLMNLIDLETNIMCMSKRLSELYIMRGKNNKDVAYEQGIYIFDFVKKVDKKNSALIELKQEKQDFEKQRLSFKTVEYPPEPEKPEMLKAYFFNKKKITALNEQAEADYQEAVKKYLVDVEECKKQTENNKNDAENKKKARIKEYSEKIDKNTKELSVAQQELKQKRENSGNYPTPAFGKKHIIDSEIKTVEETLKELFKCRNELYSYNIVFDKYRNIVALSTFYEYLMAGRCETLEGVNGAYNIYENELRLNMIITKLDEIKENQFMIYNKLRDIDSSLNTLNNTMEKAVSSLESINTNTDNMNKYLDSINKNTAVIAHNSAVTAYYSKINAELTNALGFMVALK